MNLITHNTLHYVNSNAQLWLLIIYFVLRINYSSNRYSIAIKLYVLIIYKLVMYELEECTMLNTSIGYHTFALSYKLIDSKHLKSIHKHFLRYQKKNPDMKNFPITSKNGEHIGWEFFYQNNKGIRWLLLSIWCANSYYYYGLKVIINPKALLEKEYIQAAQESDLSAVMNAYNQEASKVSSYIPCFDWLCLNRVDFCINIDLEELEIPCSPDKMMSLIRKGNIPKHFHEMTEYNKKSHRKTSYKNSFYLKSKSVTINYYDKHSQQQEGHPNFENRELSRNVIRFEVQCKYSKIYQIIHKMRKDLGPEVCREEFRSLFHHSKLPSALILTNELSEKVTENYFFKIVRKGDYFTYDLARKIIESYHFKRNKEERILYALELVKEHGGIAKAKAKLNHIELNDFKKSLRDLDEILVNPVTIPRRWKIPYIPNLLYAYRDSLYNEIFILEDEYTARKKIEAVLSDYQNKSIYEL